MVQACPKYYIENNYTENYCCCCVASAVFSSVRPHGLRPSGLLCAWDPLGKSARVGCHALLQGIFPTQIELASPALQADSLVLSHQGSPYWELHIANLEFRFNSVFWIYWLNLTTLFVKSGDELYSCTMYVVSAFVTEGSSGQLTGIKIGKPWIPAVLSEAASLRRTTETRPFSLTLQVSDARMGPAVRFRGTRAG